MSRQVVVMPAQGGPEYVIQTGSGDALSPRGRVIATALTVVLLFFGVLSCAWAGATPITGVRAAPTTAPRVSPTSTGPFTSPSPGTIVSNGPVLPGALVGAIKAEWDGPTTHLDWAGKTYATAEATFIGDRVASPGDRVERTLTLVNAGPTDAVMTVSLALAETTPAVAKNPNLDQAINLFWLVGGVAGTERFDALMSRQDARPVIAEVRVPQGQTVKAMVGFEMPAEVTEHRNGGVESDLLSFDVLVRMQGDTSAAANPADPSLAVTDMSPARIQQLARTGANVLGVVAIAAGLCLLGWLLLAATRRRRRAEDERAARA